MGEYARHNGQQVKIGTCESMYYLRADQAHLVTPEAGSVDPVADRDEIRFRFPFPDEDDIAPGAFEQYERGVKIPGWILPAELEGHYPVQFTSPKGYNLCIPCPEGVGADPGMGPIDVDGVKVHRNGWSGGPVVSQQRYIGDELLTVIACGACGAAWRLERETAEEVAVCFRSEADREEWRRKYDVARDEYLDDYGFESSHGEDGRAFMHAMADRILAGYALEEVTA